MTFTFFDDDVLSGHVEYAAELFDTERIEQLITRFRLVLDAMLADDGLRLSELPLLTRSEMSLYSMTSSPQTATARSITELVEATVDRVPDAVALQADGCSLTYRELDASANRLARWLLSRGSSAVPQWA